MMQALLKRVIGTGTLTFGAGKDGAREATFVGAAPYPSKVDQWSGRWVFQVKFHDTELIGVNRARTNILAEAESELDKLTGKYKQDIDNYILITNVPLSPVHERGTLDRLEKEVFGKYRSRVPHLAVWGADDVNRLLDVYPEVRQSYLPLLITGDIIAELLTQADKSRSDRATTIDLYLRTAISREENAQLDQAGDVSDDAVPLQDVFFDLDAYIQSATQHATERYRAHAHTRRLPIGEASRAPMVRYLVDQSAPDRVVIVGGPGEGKSTIGQYLAQLHRATLLGKADDIAISSDYIPETPRLPFRVVLKDFAQWLADHDSPDSASLDSYLSEQVTRLSTRDFTEKDLHDVLKTDPALLVLDGLDEVTDSAVRKRLVSRLGEFLERCQNGLRCDLQVVAATRPTNYNDQFDTNTFLHFRLHKLRDPQVRQYAKKWAIARVLDVDKAVRLEKTIEECIADKQISILMTTPLQVTILILIINSGGTPPRQREALFDEYLEVIYKREKAKGLGIVKTEKELLIGLHKFVGYLLHEDATNARASSATLHRPIYDKVVMGYLRNHDPYSPPAYIHDEWKAITVDAGERLVLIVESPANVFGFELRSIQEFFAACYLSDTSKNTTQRYERLAQIAYLPHWRNVALFFAGRAGRTYPGEAANVVEVCKEMDRSGADSFVKRGAEFALELASERALGPNRVLQRSLLEHGLTLFDSPISAKALQAGIELIERLPFEDIRDHILPTMERRLPNLAYAAIANACYLLNTVAPESEVLARNLLRLAAEAGTDYVATILEIAAAGRVSSELRMQVAQVLMDEGVAPFTIGKMLAFADWPVMCEIADNLTTADVDQAMLDGFTTTAISRVSYAARNAADSAVAPAGNAPLSILLRSAKALSALTASRSYSAPLISTAGRSLTLRDRISGELPEQVKIGSITQSSSYGWLLWTTHLAVGEVTPESWAKFVDWIHNNPRDERDESVWYNWTSDLAPIAGIIEDQLDESELRRFGEVAVRFGGNVGLRNWLRVLESLTQDLGKFSSASLKKLFLYGPGALRNGMRERVESVLNNNLDPRLQPMALDWLTIERGDSRLSAEDFEQISLWFVNLAQDSPWRREVLSLRLAMHAATLDRVMTDNTLAIIDQLPGYALSDLVTRVAALDQDGDGDLRFLLSHPTLFDYAQELGRFGVLVQRTKRRKVLLRLLGFTDDSDARIARTACAIVTGICRVLGHDENRSSIKSRELDSIQQKLVVSEDAFRRGTGIALYTVCPPRSIRDWNRLHNMLRTATAESVKDYWRWVLPNSADLATDPSLWNRSITSVLEEGATTEMVVVLVDVLREMLSRESQSLASAQDRLQLPAVEV